MFPIDRRRCRCRATPSSSPSPCPHPHPCLIPLHPHSQLWGAREVRHLIFLSVCTTKMAFVYHVSRSKAIHHYFISMQHHNLRRGEGFMIYLPSQTIWRNGYRDRLFLGGIGIKLYYHKTIVWILKHCVFSSFFVWDRYVAHVTGSRSRITMPRAFHLLELRSSLGLRNEENQYTFPRIFFGNIPWNIMLLQTIKLTFSKYEQKRNGECITKAFEKNK